MADAATVPAPASIDKSQPGAYARSAMLRWLLVLILSLASDAVLAQSDLRAAPAALAPPASRADTAGRFAHVAAIAGVVSAGLLLGGAVAIAALDDPGSEQVTRGLQLGYTALAAPFVAFGAYSARRSSALIEGRRVRTVGWIAYGGAIALGVSQWYGAFHETQSSPGLTIAFGALGALSVLPQAWDAYVCARYARLRSIRFGLSPFGLSLRF